jgi:hypothetical protein
MRRLMLALPLLFAPQPAYADEAAIAEIRSAWGACTAMLAEAPDDWTGWRRNYDGGYANHFEFHDGGDDAASVLVQTWMIDAIATQTDTSCYRADGTLAFLYSVMTSPNMAEGATGPALDREGRLYFDPEGNLLRVLQSITENGKEVAKTDNDRYQLARGCDLTTPHATVEEVRDHLVSELGDIEGNRGEFTVAPLSWCTLATD